MPIEKAWGEAEKEEYIAQVTDLHETVDLVEGDQGAQEIPRIYVDLADIDPTVLQRFPIRFRASRHRNSSWNRWLGVIEHLGFKVRDNPNELIGKWVHIRMEPMTSEINGEIIDWQFPRPMAIYTTEETAKAAWDEMPHPATGAGGAITEEIANLYKSLSSLGAGAQGAFKAAVKEMLPEGVTPEQAWKLVVEQEGLPV